MFSKGVRIICIGLIRVNISIKYSTCKYSKFSWVAAGIKNCNCREKTPILIDYHKERGYTVPACIQAEKCETMETLWNNGWNTNNEIGEVGRVNSFWNFDQVSVRVLKLTSTRYLGLSYVFNHYQSLHVPNWLLSFLIDYHGKVV